MIATQTLRRAKKLSLEGREDGRLLATHGEHTAVVTVHQCFPWSSPTQHLSLRDEDENEFVLVGDSRGLDGASRAALERALVDAGFVLEITGVSAIEEEVEVRCWRVTTRQGPRRFQTRLDDWPFQLPTGGLLVRDVAGDLYLLRDPAALDKRSRELMWSFVD